MLNDLIDKNGQKRIGSAQFWRKGRLLQHGEILLDPPKNIWADLFESNAPKPPDLTIPNKKLDEYLYESIKAYWPKVQWTQSQLSKEESNKILSMAKSFSFEISSRIID